jgi:hypothetical protein
MLPGPSLPAASISALVLARIHAATEDRMNARLSLLTVLVLLGGAVVAAMLWLSGGADLHPTATVDQPLAR